jgi:hypothetical protein
VVVVDILGTVHACEQIAPLLQTQVLQNRAFAYLGAVEVENFADRVPDDKDALPGDAFSQKVLLAAVGVREKD